MEVIMINKKPKMQFTALLVAILLVGTVAGCTMGANNKI